MSARTAQGQRVAFVGSRDYPNLDHVRLRVRRLPPGSIVVSGDAEGVDKVALDAARAAGFVVEEHCADWRTHGQAAGPMRNARIVASCDYMVAFQARCTRCPPGQCPRRGWSHGTGDSIAQALKAGKTVHLKRPGDAWTIRGPVAPEPDLFSRGGDQ